jgi:tRNA pseudouridine55 synthase
MFYLQEKEYYDFKEGQVILIDKPLEWTSFDVVNKMRYTLRKKYSYKKLKVGHAGTLDPLTTGLLIVCTGKFTKRIEEYQAQKKEYVTTIELGATTPSFDKETEVDERFQYEHITREQVEEALLHFTGVQDQVPPIFSAIKQGGKKAYEEARKGNELELKARQIEISSLELLDFQLPYVTIKMECSKGTYVRAFARDFGKYFNSGGYLTALKRTKIGDFQVENAMGISEFQEKVENLQLFKE